MILRYGRMEILASITEDEMVEGFLSIVRYGHRYFNLNGIGVYDFWAKSLVSKMTTLNGIQPYSLLKYVCASLHLTPRWKVSLIK